MDEEGVELWGLQCLNVVKHVGEVDVQPEVQHSCNHLPTLHNVSYRVIMHSRSKAYVVQWVG